ncbi:soluble aldose sugar dehydrogenase YliI [Maritalea myrionectae]|uniref:Soluble aldose sugar dehydrogenase YliI n=1 Tax=Maritalea myrionectae TaxID=454601 RepID=A0A2R4MEV5_9HYPH|nr:PQQ-dependent sugar dehydrogenase [Maritalea myrionectae]AVX04540.1 soluble aldose sugar dehydrogenase YliI [Maritalea myrionectae]
MLIKSLSATLFVAALVAPVAAQDAAYGGPKNVPEFAPAFENQTRAPIMQSEVSLNVEEIATGLTHPWGIAVMPNGGYLVTEREGRLRHIDAQGNLVDAPIEGVPQVFNRRQGGLLDVALAPDFEKSRVIFLTYSKPMGSGTSSTAAARAVLSEDMRTLTQVQDIFVQQPPSPTPMHYGSRIVLHNGFAYITTGEHSSRQEREYAQHLDKTYGKVIRVTPTGETPTDNPFVGQANAIDSIYALGLRNLQGAALRPGTDDIWVLGHGPRGGDELNKLQAGANYGWPVVSYGETYGGRPIGSGKPRAEGFTEPRYYWDPVIAPGGFDFKTGDVLSDWNGNIIASSLNPGGIVRLALDGDTVTGEERLLPELGRVRDIEIDKDGSILALTDSGNGKVVRITGE